MPDKSRIHILQVPDCPLVDRLLGDVQSCLMEMGINEPVTVLVGDYPSPTLLFDDLDITTGRPVDGEPRCRMDLPSRAQIRTAATVLLFAR